MMDAIGDYSYYLRMERQLSDNTAAAYCSDVADMLSFAAKKPSEISSEDLEAWFASRSELLSKRSQARVLSSLRSFFSYLVLEGERKDNPCDRIDPPKLGRYLPEVLSVDEVTRIIETADGSSWNSIRDRAILETLYGSGLRVSEACNLKISNVYLDEGFLRIVGKGDKERLVPVGGAEADAINDYLAVRPSPDGPQSEDLLFLNRFGRRLSRVSVFKMIKKAAALAGVAKEISPHSFRHAFATHLIENGADLRVVQEMLGHESILTTEIYTHIDTRTWQASILDHHPRK